MNTPLKQAYDFCVHMTKQRAKNFYYAFITLPPDGRRAICALYAYCRVLDDIADGPLPAQEKRKAIDAFREDFRESLVTPPKSPIFLALRHTIERYQIPIAYLDHVADGVSQDLTVRRYATFSDLKQYCYLVASAVGLASIEIFGYSHPDAKEAAFKMGIAMQLTNILRDIREDAADGRIYLPQDELDRFEIRPEDLLAPTPVKNLPALMQFQVERAERYYRSAKRLFTYLPRRSRPCPMILLGVYHRILKEIRLQSRRGLTHSVSLPKWTRVSIAFQLGLRGLLWKPPTSSL